MIHLEVIAFFNERTRSCDKYQVDIKSIQLIEESEILVACFIFIELPIVTTTFSSCRFGINLYLYLLQDEIQGI